MHRKFAVALPSPMNVAAVLLTCLLALILAYLPPKVGFLPSFIMVATGKEIMPSGGSDLYKHYRELLPHLDTQILTQIYTPWRRHCLGK